MLRLLKGASRLRCLPGIGYPFRVTLVRHVPDSAVVSGAACYLEGRRLLMAAQPVPRHLKKALERLEVDPARAWTVGGLAAECGVGHRTLQRQFRRFIGKTSMEYVHDLRLD